MKPNFEKLVTNWGNYPVVKKEFKSEENYQKIKKFVLNHNELIARGNGRCYGDAALGEAIFSTSKLNNSPFPPKYVYVLVIGLSYCLL